MADKEFYERAKAELFDKYLEDYKSKKISTADIGYYIGVSPTTVRKWLANAGIDRNKKSDYRTVIPAEMFERYISGEFKSAKEAAETLYVHKVTFLNLFHKWQRETGAKKPANIKKELFLNKILPEYLNREITADAAAYVIGVTPSTIHRWVVEAGHTPNSRSDYKIDIPAEIFERYANREIKYREALAMSHVSEFTFKKRYREWRNEQRRTD